MNPVIAALQRALAEVELLIPSSDGELYNWAIATRYQLEGHLHRLHNKGIR